MKSVALLNRSAVTMQRDHDDISKEGQKNETLISFLRINPEVPLLLVCTSINVWTEGGTDIGAAFEYFPISVIKFSTLGTGEQL